MWIACRMPSMRRAASAAVLMIVLACCAMALPAKANIEDAKSYLAAAQKQLRGGKLRAAEIELRNALQADPDSTVIRIELADVYLRVGNFPAAEIDARVALRKGGDKNRALPILAQSLFHQRHFDRLFTEVKPTGLNPGAESQVKLELGLAHLALGEFAQAEPLLRAAAKLEPKATGPMLGLAEFLLAKKDVKGAQSEVDAALGVAPNNPDVLRFDGELLRMGGNPADALKRFDKALATDPKHVPTLLSRADLYLAKNDMPAAKHDIDRVLILSPNNPLGIFASALMEAKSGKFKEADQTLQKVAAAMAENPKYQYLAGVIKFQLGQYALAEADATKYVASRPRDPAGKRLQGLLDVVQHHEAAAIPLLAPYVAGHSADGMAVAALGRAYMATGNNDKALELFEHVAKGEPDNPLAQMQLAVTRLRVGDTSRAVGELENIVQSGAGAKMAGPLLVMVDLHDGKVAAAAETAEKLIKLDNANPVTRTTLALVRFAQGNYADAEKILVGVIGQDPKFLTARIDLARLYMTMGRPSDAQQTLKQLLAVQANDERALLMLANIAVGENRTADAETYLRQAQQAHPSSAAPGTQLVRLYASAKNWDRANALSRELAVQFPNDLAVLDLLDQVRAASGDVSGALSDIQNLRKRYPKSANLLAQAASLEVRLKKLADARQLLVQAIALAPKEAGYGQALVDLDFQTGGGDAALKTARSFSAAQPVESALEVARVFSKMKRPDDALAALTAAQQQHPSKALLLRTAEYTYQIGKHDQAIADLQSWLKSHPDETAARFMLATFYLQEGHRDQAQAEYQRVLAEAPNNALAANNLATIYEQENDPRARTLAEQAYRELPSAEIGDTLGWILLKNADTQRAMFYLRNAGDAVPSNLTIQFHLAVGLDRTGDKKGAKAILERVLDTKRVFAERAEAEKLLATLQHG